VQDTISSQFFTGKSESISVVPQYTISNLLQRNEDESRVISSQDDAILNTSSEVNSTSSLKSGFTQPSSHLYNNPVNNMNSSALRKSNAYTIQHSLSNDNSNIEYEGNHDRYGVSAGMNPYSSFPQHLHSHQQSTQQLEGDTSQLKHASQHIQVNQNMETSHSNTQDLKINNSLQVDTSIPSFTTNSTTSHTESTYSLSHSINNDSNLNNRVNVVTNNPQYLRDYNSTNMGRPVTSQPGDRFSLNLPANSTYGEKRSPIYSKTPFGALRKKVNCISYD
jgi:hypothetical protein